jgi:hypothetical protein
MLRAPDDRARRSLLPNEIPRPKLGKEISKIHELQVKVRYSSQHTTQFTIIRDDEIGGCHWSSVLKITRSATSYPPIFFNHGVTQ